MAGGLLGYLLWYVLYQYFLKDYTLIDEWLIHSMVLSVESVLRAMGFVLYEVASHDFRWQVGIDQSVGLLEVGAPCDGLVLFVLFGILFWLSQARQRKTVVHPGWDCCYSRCELAAGFVPCNIELLPP